MMSKYLLLMISVLFCTPHADAFGMFSFWKTKSSSKCECPDGSKVNTGDPCTGGGLCLGEFRGYKYMVTPSGCTDSATPTCDGSDDVALSKSWRGSSITNVDIPDVENVATQAAPSLVLGDINTAAIVAHPNIGANSAAKYCYDMEYGGHDDWYLPSKSELTFLACKSSKTLDPTDPLESPQCAGDFGGKENKIKLNISYYWSSTELSSSSVWTFTSREWDYNKHYLTFGIRCIRRY